MSRATKSTTFSLSFEGCRCFCMYFHSFITQCYNFRQGTENFLMQGKLLAVETNGGSSYVCKTFNWQFCDKKVCNFLDSIRFKKGDKDVQLKLEYTISLCLRCKDMNGKAQSLEINRDQRLSKSLKAAFLSDNFSDATLKCKDGETIPVHKIILSSRSEVT